MFVMSFASAFGESISIDDRLKDGLIVSDSAKEYPSISIKGFWDFLPLIESTKADLVLTKHDETCGINCMSEFQITTYGDSALIDNIIFYKNESNNWLESNIRSYQFYIWDNPLNKEEIYYEDVCSGSTYDEEGNQLTSDVCEKVEKTRITYYKMVDDYTTECSPAKLTEDEIKNETKPYNVCIQIVSGQTEEYYDGYSAYTIGTIMPKGTYTVKLEGQKRAD